MSCHCHCHVPFLNETNNFFLRSDHTAKSKLPIGPTWPMQPWPMQPIGLRHHPKDPTRRPGPPPGPPLLPFVSLLPLPWPLACSNWLFFCLISGFGFGWAPDVWAKNSGKHEFMLRKEMSNRQLLTQVKDDLDLPKETTKRWQPLLQQYYLVVLQFRPVFVISLGRSRTTLTFGRRWQTAISLGMGFDKTIGTARTSPIWVSMGP